MINGYIPGEEGLKPVPQAKHRLEVRIDKVLTLSTGPHSDE